MRLNWKELLFIVTYTIHITHAYSVLIKQFSISYSSHIAVESNFKAKSFAISVNILLDNAFCWNGKRYSVSPLYAMKWRRYMVPFMFANTPTRTHTIYGKCDGFNFNFVGQVNCVIVIVIVGDQIILNYRLK